MGCTLANGILLGWGLMKAISSAWTSSLTTKELADLFRTTSETIFSTPSRRFAAAIPGRSAAGKMTFFTPKEVDDDPFSQFDDQPAFSAGVQGPQGGKVNGASPVTIHMYVYDNGPTRKVVFSAPYQLPIITKGKAEDHVHRYAAALAQRDRQAREK
jgi:hypothetical protein